MKKFVEWYFDYKYYDSELKMVKNNLKSLNASLASGNFCCLLITFANSLDQDQVRSSGPYLDPNYFDTLIGFLKELFKQVNFDKKTAGNKKAGISLICFFTSHQNLSVKQGRVFLG